MNQEKEIWKPIIGYEGLYEVSNLGRVKTLSKIVNNYPNTTRVLPEKIRLGNINKKLGYRMISLSKDGDVHTMYVHRLVALAFIPNPKNFPMINHKDEDKTNNNVSNLEWCTPRYNMAYSNVFDAAKLKNSIPVCQYDMDGVFIKRYNSSYDAARKIGVKPYCISYCCLGKIGSVKGFLWKYEDEDREKIKHTRVSKRRVVQMDINGNELKIWSSIREAALSTRSNESLIGRCCNNKRNNTNGFKWKYFDANPIVF